MFEWECTNCKYTPESERCPSCKYANCRGCHILLMPDTPPDVCPNCKEKYESVGKPLDESKATD